MLYQDKYLDARHGYLKNYVFCKGCLISEGIFNLAAASIFFETSSSIFQPKVRLRDIDFAHFLRMGPNGKNLQRLSHHDHAKHLPK